MDNNNAVIKLKLDDLTKQFFNLFTNKGNSIPPIEHIYTICIPEGMIIKNLNAQPEIYSLEQFIAPRKKILTDGTLINFSEEETSEKTEIFGNIAHRFCGYKKSGILNGKPYEGTGMKTIQFINTAAGWKISAVAWDDKQN